MSDEAGPRAPQRKRKRRLAKKLALRGGMLRTCGHMQRFYARWPAMAEWVAGNDHPLLAARAERQEHEESMADAYWEDRETRGYL